MWRLVIPEGMTIDIDGDLFDLIQRLTGIQFYGFQD